MSKPRPALPPAYRELLDASGLPWSAEFGGRRIKVRVAGDLVAVISQGRAVRAGGRNRNHENTLSALRRAIRQKQSA